MYQKCKIKKCSKKSYISILPISKMPKITKKVSKFNSLNTFYKFAYNRL